MKPENKNYNNAKVVLRFGNELLLETKEKKIFRCFIRKSFKNIVTGDSVSYQRIKNDVVIDKLHERKNFLQKKDSYGKTKTLASNIDHVFVVIALQPKPQWELLDKYLVTAANMPAACSIIINKVDLDKNFMLSDIGYDLKTFTNLKYPVFITSAHTNIGLKKLNNKLDGSVSIFVGQSGVGKSSLIKALLPDQEIRIGELSGASGSGKHTTTNVALYNLTHGGQILDSPGVRTFEPDITEFEQIDRGFIEINQNKNKCKFNNCRHVDEPECAIKEAIDENRIDARRYASYVKMCSDLKNRKNY
jgi:ribosome biogenesis GTPase